MKTREQINARLNQAGSDVKSMGRNLWLAGLGAMGSADEKGREILSDLIRRGEGVEGGPEALASKRWKEAAGRVKTLGDQVEGRIEDGMSKTLNRFGVPARRDVEALSEQVATLTRHVESLR